MEEENPQILKAEAEEMEDIRKHRLRRLEERPPVGKQLLALLLAAVEDAPDFEVNAVKGNRRGPLNGVSQQIVGVFTDKEGKDHEVSIVAYLLDRQDRRDED
jgi:hypothetical protein